MGGEEMLAPEGVPLTLQVEKRQSCDFFCLPILWLLRLLPLTREGSGDLTTAAIATDYEVTSRAVPVAEEGAGGRASLGAEWRREPTDYLPSVFQS